MEVLLPSVSSLFKMNNRGSDHVYPSFLGVAIKRSAYCRQATLARADDLDKAPTLRQAAERAWRPEADAAKW